jgi:hypothetical protein
LQKLLKSEPRILKCHIEPGNQTQTFIFGLPIAEESNRQAVNELLEKQKKLLGTIDALTETLETNNWTIQELRNKQKQHLDSNDIQTKTVEAMQQAVSLPCAKQKYVCTCKIETITTSK